MVRTPAMYPIAAAVVLLVASGGCLSHQYSEFRGSLTRGDAAPAPHGTYPLGRSFGRRVPEVPGEAVYGVSIGEVGGYVMFVYKVDQSAPRLHLGTETINAVYYTDTFRWNDEALLPTLLRLPAERREEAGVRRLYGGLVVERWNSSIDFRIRLAMRTEDAPAVRIDGTLAMFERLEFRPLEFFALLGMALGLVSPG